MTILPMRSGTGIKNKLLEAAAMGRPIVASPHAVRGLMFDGLQEPLAICDQPAQWIETICRLWSDPALRARLGNEARQWVVRRHSWQAAAAELVRWIDSIPAPAPGSGSGSGSGSGLETPDTPSLREAA